MKASQQPQTNCSPLSWRTLRRGCDGDEVPLEYVDVPAQLGHDGRDVGGGQVARHHEEGALVVPLAVHPLPLGKLALLAQALEFPDIHREGVRYVSRGRDKDKKGPRLTAAAAVDFTCKIKVAAAVIQNLFGLHCDLSYCRYCVKGTNFDL